MLEQIRNSVSPDCHLTVGQAHAGAARSCQEHCVRGRGTRQRPRAAVHKGILQGAHQHVRVVSTRSASANQQGPAWWRHAGWKDSRDEAVWRASRRLVQTYWWGGINSHKIYIYNVNWYEYWKWLHSRALYFHLLSLTVVIWSTN